jgi:ASC-1-like (ASCH) protein
LDLFIRKNADYGDAFATFGTIGVLVRIQDKMNRAITLDKNKISLVDESIRDTLIDLHNYAAMALMLKDESTEDLLPDVD